MNDIVLNGLIAIGTAGATGGMTYFLTRKRNNADIKATGAQTHISELDATEKAVAIWRNLAQDLNAQVQELRALIVELRQENEKLHIEINGLREEIRINRNNINSK